MANSLDRIRHTYGRLSTTYDRSAGRWDRILGLDAGRRWVCTRAQGEVLEVGVGTGLSLPHYNPDIRLTAIDLTPEMLDRAEARAADLGIAAQFRVGDAQALEVDSGTVDTVIFTLSLCTIPAPRRAIAEAWRVLRAGGQLLLIEHVRSPNPVVRAGQRFLDPLFRRLEADNLLREPLEHVRQQGFHVEELERSALGIVERLRATKPSNGGLPALSQSTRRHVVKAVGGTPERGRRRQSPWDRRSRSRDR